jgi:maleylpyruvate isomerase
VRSARGRAIPAAEVPWMRAREAWLHAVDLQIGVSAEQLPPEFATTLIADVVGFFNGVGDVPAVRLRSGERSWSIGAGGPLVEGEPAQLAAWLTGRSDGGGLQGARLPKLPAWL